eukprot:CAMPEP_0204882632 /NCGR_PEP_ID=MMETSP1349-20130617/3626_1 /ASSEMBLY_ACC=CAM_ASM_000710 /TAXON_ID=215587 /ORGANISM="Aplanochytrium stocchinoi, Strain GSBS06" /LENGTH=116 /DNA_ID=CAMNT_0052042067 /DNA_START=2666 /DNA_END=3013 /DNA_ORIENTATION=-
MSSDSEVAPVVSLDDELSDDVASISLLPDSAESVLCPLFLLGSFFSFDCPLAASSLPVFPSLNWFLAEDELLSDPGCCSGPLSAPTEVSPAPEGTWGGSLSGLDKAFSIISSIFSC